MKGSAEWEHPATLALRAGSVAELRGWLIADLRRHAGDDPRDTMLDLTPYHDAATRLGASPVEVFDAAASADSVPDDVAALARTFGRRTDLTLGVMGWRLEETAEGPAYRFAWPKWTPPKAAGRAEVASIDAPRVPEGSAGPDREGP